MEKEKLVMDFYKTGHSIFRTIRKNSISRVRVGEYKTSELRLILHVPEEGGRPISAISKRMHIEKSNMTMLVDGLVEKGIIKRERSLKDRRVINLALTEKGKTEKQKVSDEYENKLYGLLDQVTKEELDVVLNSLKIIEKKINRVKNEKEK